MTPTNKVVIPLGVLCAASLWGCAQTVPKELADARAAYNRAANGQAQDWSPADLHGAHTALEHAESSFNEDGASANTRDLAYVALRKTQIAEAKAATLAAENQAQQAEARAEQAQSQAHAQAVNQLNQTREQLEGQNAARQEAEKRAKQALDELARVAAVKQEERGTVITLSGSVLFESGESELLPGAESRLEQVAQALTSREPDSPIIVEGYTDSQGSKRFNERLSKMRAEAVRSYLISKGVAPDRIRAEGFGPERPVADNKSPEGRANNRRVEIVVPPEGAATPGGA